jgi:hypothetical protein
MSLMMKAVRNFETSVNFNVTTRRYIPEDSKLHTRRRENLKFHIFIFAAVRTLNLTKKRCVYSLKQGFSNCGTRAASGTPTTVQ